MPEPLPAPDERTDTSCSARGCRAAARFDLQWNNPKIHTADRSKHWLACDDHRDALSAFLSDRGFLRDVVALAP